MHDIRYLAILAMFGLPMISNFIGIPLATAQHQSLTFSVMGDTPYEQKEEVILQQQIADHNLFSPSEFMVHVGDIRGITRACVESDYEKVASYLSELRVPTFVIPGDNEWTDCRDPGEAWTYWTKHFDRFEQHSCGASTVERQSIRPENFAWFRKGVLLIGLNMVGGRGRENDPIAWDQRLEQNAEWVRQQIQGNGSNARALVVFAHAWRKQDRVFEEPFLEMVRDFEKPVLYLMGEHHKYSLKEKYKKEANLTKLIVDKGAKSIPLQVTVTLDNQETFLFNRKPWDDNSTPMSHNPCGDSGEDPPLPQTTALRFSCSDDAYVRSNRQTENFGSKPDLQLREASSIRYAYLKFKLSGLQGPIESAKLRLSVTDGGDDGGALFLVSNSYAGTSDLWDEHGINWANAPTVFGTPVSSVANVGVGTVEFDVADVISGNGAYSFAIKNNSSNRVKYSSKEGGTSPEIVVELKAKPVPLISSFEPSFGSHGTKITLFGRNLKNISIVNFDGIPTIQFIVISDMQIVATVPIGAQTGRIVVTNPEGTGESSRDFVLVGPPEIESFHPDNGPVGTEVTVSGTQLAAINEVSFSGVPGSFAIDSDLQLRAHVPFGANSGTITVRNQAGSDVSTNDFQVTAAPIPSELTFSAIEDAYVRSNQATRNYGNSAIIDLRVESSVYNGFVKFAVSGLPGPVKTAKIRLMVAEGASFGSGIYRVANHYKGTSRAWRESGLTWENAPEFEGNILDAIGAVRTLQSVEFDVTAAISGNGIFSFGLQSTDRMGFSSKEGLSAPQLVIEVETTDAPLISSFSPVYGVPGTEVTLVGFNFDGTTGVVLDLISAIPYIVDSENKLRITVPSNAKTGKFRVANSHGSGESAKEFIVIAAPTIAAFSPSGASQGEAVTITGTGFTGTTEISFNGTLATGFTTPSDSQLQVDVPAGASTGQISVRNTAGSATSVEAFEVTPLPTVYTYFPSEDAYVRSTRASSNYGRSATIQLRRSSAFYNGYLKFEVTGLSKSVERATLRLRVTDPGESGGSIFAVSNSYLNSTAPWGEAGLTWDSAPLMTGTALSSLGPVEEGRIVEYDVTTAVRSNGTFSFGIEAGAGGRVKFSSKEGDTPPELLVELSSKPTPIISSFTPPAGRLGSEVTLVGANLAGVTDVRFNGTRASVFVVDSDANLRAHVPPGATTGVITLTSAEGEGSSQTEFTVVSPPQILSFTPSDGHAGTEVTISGLNLGVPTGIAFNGVGVSSFSVDSGSQVRAQVPDLATTGLILFSNAAGTAASVQTFTVTPAPIILTFLPTDDAYVKLSVPEKTSASARALRAKKSESEEITSYLKFAVSGLAGDLRSAKIVLSATSASEDGGTIHLVSNSYKRTTSPWSEQGLNWGNAPTIFSPASDSAGVVQTGDSIEFEITPTVTGDGVYSFAIRNNSSDAVKYSSKEGKKPPMLVLAFNDESISKRGDWGAVSDLKSGNRPSELPDQVRLVSIYPNPFNLETRVSYSLRQVSRVELAIYNIRGRRVRTMVDGFQEAGQQRARWSARDDHGFEVAAGIYLVRLKVGSEVLVRKLTLLK